MPVKGFLVTTLKVGDTSFSGTDWRRPLCFRGVLIGLPSSTVSCPSLPLRMSELSCFSLRVWTESSMPLLLHWECKASCLGAPVASEFSAIAGILTGHLPASPADPHPLTYAPPLCSYIFTLKVQFLSKGFPDKIHWYPGSSHLPSRSSYVFVCYPLRILYTFSEHLPELGAGLLRAGVDSFLLHSNAYYPCHAFLQFSLAYQFLYLLSPSLEGRDPILDL